MKLHNTLLFWDLTYRQKTKLQHFSVSFRMVGCTPFLIVSYFYLWFVPPFINRRFIWYLGFYCLYQTLITVSMTPVPDTGLMFQNSEMAPKRAFTCITREKSSGKEEIKALVDATDSLQMRGCVTFTNKSEVGMITVASCQSPTARSWIYALICETCCRLEPRALRCVASKGKWGYLGCLLLLWSRPFISASLRSEISHPTCATVCADHGGHAAASCNGLLF